MVEQTLYTSETITRWALASNLQRTVSHTSMTRDRWLVTLCPDYLLRAPKWLTYVGVWGHIVWCNSKGVVIEKFCKHIGIQRPKIHQKHFFFSWVKISVGQSNQINYVNVGVRVIWYFAHTSVDTGEGEMILPGTINELTLLCVTLDTQELIWLAASWGFRKLVVSMSDWKSFMSVCLYSGINLKPCCKYILLANSSTRDVVLLFWKRVALRYLQLKDYVTVRFYRTTERKRIINGKFPSFARLFFVKSNV